MIKQNYKSCSFKQTNNMDNLSRVYILTLFTASTQFIYYLTLFLRAYSLLNLHIISSSFYYPTLFIFSFTTLRRFLNLSFVKWDMFANPSQLSAIHRNYTFKLSFNRFVYQLPLSLQMTEIPLKKTLPKTTHYPKSNRPNMAKLQYNPKSYEYDLKKIDYFAFGDSFVNMFLHAQNTFYIKLKGKSIRGLAKTDKEERGKIQKWIKATPKHVTLVFNFGQVDLNFIRYFKLTRGEIYPEQTFNDYIDWIGSLDRKCIVLGVFASPIDSQNILETLLKYGTVEDVEPFSNLLMKEHAKTQDTRKRWNELMEANCKKQKSVKFLNLFPYHQDINKKFLDQSPKTIHLRYLPCIMELSTHLPNIKIDIQKSLEIESEYVEEKTKRYELRLLDLEQENQNESEQENQSKDAFDEQQTNENHSNQQFLEDQQENERFIDLLGIEGIDSPEKLFDKIRTPKNSELLQKLADRIIELGIFWVNIEHFDCCMVNFYLVNSLTLIKDVTEAQQEMQSAEIPFQKIIRSKLQEYFEKNLHSNDKTRVIEDVITLIVYFYLDQKTFDLSILPQKLIFMVMKQILLSVFKRIVSSNPDENDGVVADFNCFFKLKYEFEDRMSEIFNKQNSKKKINEPAFYSKFLELLLCKNLEGQKLEEKVVQVEGLLNEEFPYAIYSPKVSEELLKMFNIELDFYEFRKSLKLSQKYLMISQQNTISIMKQRLLKVKTNLTKSLTKIKEQSEEKMKSIEEDVCCKCGGLRNILSPTKGDKESPKKGDKESKK